MNPVNTNPDTNRENRQESADITPKPAEQPREEHPSPEPLEKIPLPGTGEILLPIEEEPPMTEADLVYNYGEPVIYQGINLTAAANQYLQEVHNPENSPGKSSTVPDMKTAVAQYLKDDLILTLRIVIDHDCKAHLKAGYPKFDDYVHSFSQRNCAHSTIHRKLIVGKFILYFSARGAIDLLPSQAACEVVGRLARNHWLPCWKQISPTGTRVGKQKLVEHVSQYACYHSVPLRGHLVELEPVPVQKRYRPDSELLPEAAIPPCFPPEAINDNRSSLLWKCIDDTLGERVAPLTSARNRKELMKFFTRIYESDEDRGDLMIELMIANFVSGLLRETVKNNPSLELSL